MKDAKGALLAGVLLALVAVPVVAHHSFSSTFDSNRKVSVKGTVAKLEWINPHVYFHVDVPEADGQVTRWMFEMHSPGTMRRDGLTRAMLPVGMEVEVDGYGSRDGSSFAWGNTIRLEDGRVIHTYTPRDGDDPRATQR